MRENATGRFVFVPASEFGGNPVHVGGWTGEIKSVDKRSKQGTVTIKFFDKTMYFPFEYVLEKFNPIS